VPWRSRSRAHPRGLVCEAGSAAAPLSHARAFGEDAADRRPLGVRAQIDGVRALVDTHDRLRIRSRRGRNIAALVPELAGLPDASCSTASSSPGSTVCRASPGCASGMLYGRQSIAVTYMVFDVLYVDGESAMVLPYAERRALLEELELVGPAWHTPCAFDDGEALYEAVCAQGLEGVVVKRLSSAYRPDGRGWVKTRTRRTGGSRTSARRGGRRPRRSQFRPSGHPCGWCLDWQHAGGVVRSPTNVRERLREWRCFWRWPIGHRWQRAGDEDALGHDKRCIDCGKEIEHHKGRTFMG
jgi:ATP dependent DNA ligase domain